MSNQTTVAFVTIAVRVPGVHSEATVANMVEELLGEGQFACEALKDDPDVAAAAVLAGSASFSNCRAEVCEIDGPDCDVDVDFDNASYVGDGDDGVYYQVFEDSKGDYWYSASVDCNSSGFCEPFAVGVGPYENEDRAERSARDEALDWCMFNGVNTGDGDDDCADYL